jgi:endonuclease YncB( thermonuclease family)
MKWGILAALLLTVSGFLVKTQPATTPASHSSRESQQAALWGDTAYHVTRVFNGKSFQVTGGLTVRLACLQVPNIPEKSGKMRAGQPMGEEATKALTRLIKGKKVTLSPFPAMIDRHGRRVAIATLPDGQTVQAELLQQGMAVVYPFPDQQENLAELLEIERHARQAKRGIWGHPYWKPVQAENLVGTRLNADRYQLVEGIVQEVAQVGKNGDWYLNFGSDRHTDFTAYINKKDYTQYFKKRDLHALQGKRILLRGWVYSRDGIMMDIIQPEQIETET